MVIDQKYKSTIKSRPFLYIETKKLSNLVLEGLNEIEIKKEIINENIFQVKTESRRREIASTILERIKVLDDFLMRQTTTSDIETSKFIVLYSIIKTDRLFYEFINEVFSEKLIVMDMHLVDRDFNLFFEVKRQQSETVSKWREYTFYKLKQVYIRILFEAGLIKNQKGKRYILKTVIDPAVKDHFLKIGEKHFLEIMGGE